MQACRGNAQSFQGATIYDPRANADDPNAPAAPYIETYKESNDGSMRLLGDDVVELWASPPQNQAFRTGDISFFVDSLCRMLRTHGEDKDIQFIFQQVTSHMRDRPDVTITTADGPKSFKLASYIEHRLRKRLLFFDTASAPIQYCGTVNVHNYESTDPADVDDCVFDEITWKGVIKECTNVRCRSVITIAIAIVLALVGVGLGIYRVNFENSGDLDKTIPLNGEHVRIHGYYSITDNLLDLKLNTTRSISPELIISEDPNTYSTSYRKINKDGASYDCDSGSECNCGATYSFKDISDKSLSINLLTRKDTRIFSTTCLANMITDGNKCECFLPWKKLYLYLNFKESSDVDASSDLTEEPTEDPTEDPTEELTEEPASVPEDLKYVMVAEFKIAAFEDITPLIIMCVMGFISSFWILFVVIHIYLSHRKLHHQRKYSEKRSTNRHPRHQLASRSHPVQSQL